MLLIRKTDFFISAFAPMFQANHGQSSKKYSANLPKNIWPIFQKRHGEDESAGNDISCGLFLMSIKYP